MKTKKSSAFGEGLKRFRRNKLAIIGTAVLAVLFLMCIFENVIAPGDYNAQDYSSLLQPPSGEHLFGTDQYGRDIFSRIIHGAKYTLSAGFISTAVAAIFGIPIGTVAGFYGGRIDNFIMRAVDIIMTMPMILLATIMSTVLGNGLFNTMLAVGIAGAPAMARITRSSIMSVKNNEYVEAAISNNASNARIMFRYLLPNGIAPIIVAITLGLASSIIACSSLSFLGLGLSTGTPEWGAMLSAGRTYMKDSWWICTMPGLFVAVTVLAINLMGDGLRDALDPKQKR